MTKVVVAKLKPNRAVVQEKRVLHANGRVATMQTLDAASRTFGDELEAAFVKNVQRARRADKRIIGSADIAPRKA